MILSIIVFILILSVLVFVHELGHFAVAKWTGMKVDEFSIGFPPRIWQHQYKDTNYCIGAVPLGGYCKIRGENPEDNDDDAGSFQNKSVWARIAVILAGVTMNLLFAFVVLTVAFSVGFISVSQELETMPGAKIVQSETLVVDVLANSAASRAGVVAGDLITAITDSQTNKTTQITSSQSLIDLTKTLQNEHNDKIVLLYSHNGLSKQVHTTIASSGPALGIEIQSMNTVRLPVWEAPRVAINEIGFIIQMTWDALKGFASQLFVHGKLDSSVSGPVGIYQATSTAAHEGVIPTIFLMIALSINLALLNILPIPALDGGKFVFLLTELAFRKRVIAEKVENWLSLISFAALILLIVVITARDVIHLI